MPRVSEAEKQRSHSKILDSAARLFRENGIEATSVADVMKAAGMTHGGFYRHFASKEELVADAFRHAVDGVVDRIERETTIAGKARETDAYIETYLSDTHVHEWGKGCPLAAMGVEIARAGGETLQEGAEASKRMAGILQRPDDANGEQGLASMAIMMGAVTLARLAKTKDEADLALKAGREGLSLLREHWVKA